MILQGCPIRVHFSVSGSPSTSGEPARPTAQRCEHESQPSPASTTPSTVTFDNARNSPARLYWIDFEGRRIFYHLLLPGETLVQPTYRSHRRVATSEEGQCLGLFEANSSASVVTLGAIDR